MVTCKFCKQEFLKKSTLTRHLETAKYCNTGKEKISFDCSFCSKKLASKPRLEYHTNICKAPKKTELVKTDITLELMNQVQRMKLEIDELKRQQQVIRQQVNQQHINTNLTENENDTEEIKEENKENKEETSVQQPYKKKAIPKSLKMLVWHTYIGKEVGLAKCLCCKNKEITQMDFDCGHVVAESRGGVTTVNNMRPICAKCNRSMKAMDMNDFIEKYFT
jgi:5-methylcytosine-specific restriction endonuclease McrA